MTSRKRTGKEVTIIGYVAEIESDYEDFIGVMISADEGDYYVSQKNKLGKNLSNLIDEDVEVTGILSEDEEDGIRYITVTDYEVLDLDYGYEDEEDRFYEDEDDYYK